MAALIGRLRLVCSGGLLLQQCASTSCSSYASAWAAAALCADPSRIGAHASTSAPALASGVWQRLGGGGTAGQLRGYAAAGAAEGGTNYAVGLHNLRDNPGATRQRIRVGRGDSARRGNYSGRGMKGQKARGRGLHMLFDGGQLGLLKFPVTRQKPPYEVLYNHLGLSRVAEFVQLGLLDPTRTITMKDLYDTGCVTRNIKYGVLLYGKARLTLPLDIQVTACDGDARRCLEGVGGCITRVYYTKEGLQGILHPEKYTGRHLPLPLPAAGWHPKHASKFEQVGLIPPAVRQLAVSLPGAGGVAAAAAAVPLKQLGASGGPSS